MDKQKIYDDICSTLTDFEQIDLSDLDNWSDTADAIDNLYTNLVFIKDNWNDLTSGVTGAALVCWLGAQMDSFEEYMNNNIDSDPDYYGYDETTLYKLLNYVAETDNEILEEEYHDCRK